MYRCVSRQSTVTISTMTRAWQFISALHLKRHTRLTLSYGTCTPVGGISPADRRGLYYGYHT